MIIVGIETQGENERHHGHAEGAGDVAPTPRGGGRDETHEAYTHEQAECPRCLDDADDATAARVVDMVVDPRVETHVEHRLGEAQNRDSDGEEHHVSTRGGEDCRCRHTGQSDDHCRTSSEPIDQATSE